MPDKHEHRRDAHADTFFALPEHHVIALEGRDAAAFAQAQFINDVAALEPGAWQWSGWLTPKGRVLALFALLKRDPETIWLVVADTDAAALVQSLSRYLFRSKTSIRVCGDLHVAGSFAAPELARGSTSAALAGGAVELDVGGKGGARGLRIAAASAAPNDDGVAQWRLFDLEHGWPRLDAGQVEHWTPQQLSLQRLDGFSVKKGCYPGQEIVARTHFLGKAKRGLVLLEADAALAAGGEVHGGGRALGSIVSTASGDGRHLALAVLPLERETMALEAGGMAVRQIQLEDGLVR